MTTPLLQAGPSGQPGAPARPRVVLVDDDPSIRRLVALVLDELPVTLVSCATVAEARRALAAAPARLLITDLMMPGETGYDLLQQLAQRPALAGGARCVVFSAGLDAAAQQRLQALGVWRMLSKPVSIQALIDCVQAALDASAEPADPVADPSTGRAVDLAAAPAAAPGADPAADPAATQARAAAIAAHFAGDAALYDAFRASCLPLFLDDIVQGDAATAAHDAPTLVRLGHSLKSVLRTLGIEAGAAEAQALEAAARAADSAASGRCWQALRRRLQALAATA